MTINGTSKVCGVIGCPVEHSVSPMMHNFFSEELGLDLVYAPFLVQPGKVGEAVKGAFALNIHGLNVTVPHKQAVMEHLCGIDEGALAIGAVNTLVRQADGYKGYNTDAEGILRAMLEAGMDIAGRTCILLGAGGAAKAAAYVLVREKAAKVYLLNRSLEKAQGLAAEMDRLFGTSVCQAMALDDWREIQEEHCLAVQTTSVGMGPHAGQAVIEDEAFYRKLDMAFDAIYNPMETKFLAMARAAGAKTENGLGMLLYQGVAAYELWNPEVRIPAELAARARERLIAHLEGRRLEGRR